MTDTQKPIITLLVVDDELLNRRINSARLGTKREGKVIEPNQILLTDHFDVRIITADNRPDAASKIAENQIDIIVTDCDMPIKDVDTGFEPGMRLLENEAANIPVKVMVTGSDADTIERRQEAVSELGGMVFPKPCDFDSLATYIIEQIQTKVLPARVDSIDLNVTAAEATELDGDLDFDLALPQVEAVPLEDLDSLPALHPERDVITEPPIFIRETYILPPKARAEVSDTIDALYPGAVEDFPADFLEGASWVAVKGDGEIIGSHTENLSGVNKANSQTKVLVITERNKPMSKLMQAMYEKRGYDVTAVDNAEALAEKMGDGYDLVAIGSSDLGDDAGLATDFIIDSSKEGHVLAGTPKLLYAGIDVAEARAQLEKNGIDPAAVCEKPAEQARFFDSSRELTGHIEDLLAR